MRYSRVMKATFRFHNRFLAAFLVLFFGIAADTGAALAQTAKLDELFTGLLAADDAGADQIVTEIWIEWSKSGSPSIDLLLQRGRAALAAGVPQVAIEHLTAAIDQDPAFAEAWNARATAYFQTGDLGPSVADIAHVLTLNPRHFGALSGLGMIFEELGKPAKALEAYKAALAVNPHMPDVKTSVERLEKDLAGQDL